MQMTMTTKAIQTAAEISEYNSSEQTEGEDQDDLLNLETMHEVSLPVDVLHGMKQDYNRCLSTVLYGDDANLAIK